MKICCKRSDCKYHVSCEPRRIFWNDDTTCSTWVSCVLPTTDWIPGFSACSGQHAWHSCRAGCIVISEDPQGLATHISFMASHLAEPNFESAKPETTVPPETYHVWALFRMFKNALQKKNEALNAWLIFGLVTMLLVKQALPIFWHRHSQDIHGHSQRTFVLEEDGGGGYTDASGRGEGAPRLQTSCYKLSSLKSFPIKNIILSFLWNNH